MPRSSVAFYRVACAVLGAAVRLHFRRLEARHRERVPRSGPLLVVANHPASVTDAIVLMTALPRRLRFVAMAPIFEPWPAGLALRLGGAIPVHRRVDDGGAHSNEATFRDVQAALEAGEAVVVFPEGTSETDRTLVRFRTGAARMALAYAGAAELSVLPVGLHFANRARFGSDVVVSIGRVLDLAPFRGAYAADPAAAVRALTARIEDAVGRLILRLDATDRRQLVESIEHLFADDARAAAGGPPRLAVARGMAECVEHFARTDPERLAAGWRRIRHYRRRLAAAGVHDAALRAMLPRQGRRRERARLLAAGLLGLVPAAVGAAVHVVPYALSGRIARRLTHDPARIAAHRIALGLGLVPATYAVIAFALHAAGMGVRGIAGVLAPLPLLGLHAAAYLRWVRLQGERVRLVLMGVGHRRALAGLRRERRELTRLFEAAWRDFRDAEAGGDADPRGRAVG